LPPDYNFLWQVRQPGGATEPRRLTRGQARELAAFSERWLDLKERWKITGGPGEQPPREAWPELNLLEGDLRRWGLRQGFIDEGPEYIIPEFREAVEAWRAREAAKSPQPAGPAAPSGRLTLDPLTHTVTLDGVEHKVDDPKAFAVYQVIAGACPQPVTRAGIRGQVRGCHGTRKVRDLLDSLPGPLRGTVCSGRNGYWLDLGAPRRRRRKGRT
jgi:hypothetical protein